MASRLIVLTTVLAACQAAPFWITENGFLPGTIFIREGRSSEFAPPSIAYGFGSGFSSNIGGISHSTGISSSFQTGDGQAFGSGIGSSDGGNVFARGIGYASTNPAPQQQLYRTSYPYGYSSYNGLRRNYGNNYGSAVSSAQNLGNYGSAVAQSLNSPYGASANRGQYQSAISSAQNLGGLRGYGSSVASASSGGFGSAATSSSGGFGTAISSAHSRDAHGYNAAVSASQNTGDFRASTAQTVQQNGGSLQQSGASSVNAPGFQATQSHAINTY